MLVELSIEHFALIDRLTVEFAGGLNIFSGETGVGKSMTIDALNAVLGQRASADLIRAGADEAVVSALFEIGSKELLEEVTRIAEIDTPDDNTILLRRSVQRSGRSRGSVNGRTVTMGMLREIGKLIVDIHGQFDQQMLLVRHGQIDILDAYGRLGDTRRAYREAFEAWRATAERRRELTEGQEERLRRLDYLTFQLEELNALKLKPGEIEELTEKSRRMAHVERIAQAAGEAVEALYDGDRSVSAQLARIVRTLREAAKFDPRLAEAAGRIESVRVEAEDIAETVRPLAEDEEMTEADIEAVQSRLDAIARIRSKYGKTYDEIEARRQALEKEVAFLSGDTTELEEIDRTLAEQQTAMVEAGRALDKARRKAAESLAKRVNASLKHLGMPRARFSVSFEAIDPEAPAAKATASGLAGCEFTIQTNPGEAAGPLGRIASGGELSRTMLALKEIVAQSDRTSVLVFDEIDSSVGPRMGAVIADKLEAIGKAHQVLCITHLGQIAARGQVQFKISKHVKDRRTYTKVERLDGEARINEIAEMIAGPEFSEHTRKEAEELLAKG